MRNEPQLITYVDRLGGTVRGLHALMDGPLAGAFGGVHLLPFFTPIDGADAGFDPSDHTEVDPRIGDWSDVARLGAETTVLADLIVNHISADSPQFRDWQERGSDSPFDGMFLTLDSVFPHGVDDAQLDLIYRPRPGRPLTGYDVAGETKQLWTTFTNRQIDIDVGHPAAWDYLVAVIDQLAASGVSLVRLDAVGYAVKKRGTPSFMIPETFDFIDRVTAVCRDRGMGVLVEIRSHHRHQIEVAAKVDRVYDFALPALVLHALHTGDALPLRHWLTIAPRNCLTVLDTHDGIGIVDVAPEGELEGLLDPEQVDALVDTIHDATEGRSRVATGQAASNLDLYQVNSSLYEALRSDDDAHFLARLIQVLCPGVPQVYYGGLLATPNQMELFSRTGVGRDINRPYYDDTTLAEALDRSIVQDTLALLRWRRTHHALFDGSFELLEAAPNEVALRWTTSDQTLEARIDVVGRTFRIDIGDQVFTLPDHLR